jgi:hypothetical protein
MLSSNHETLNSNLYSEEKKKNQHSSTKTEPPRLTQVMRPGEAVAPVLCHAKETGHLEDRVMSGPDTPSPLEVSRVSYNTTYPTDGGQGSQATQGGFESSLH